MANRELREVTKMSPLCELWDVSVVVVVGKLQLLPQSSSSCKATAEITCSPAPPFSMCSWWWEQIVSPSQPCHWQQPNNWSLQLCHWHLKDMLSVVHVSRVLDWSLGLKDQTHNRTEMKSPDFGPSANNPQVALVHPLHCRTYNGCTSSFAWWDTKCTNISRFHVYVIRNCYFLVSTKFMYNNNDCHKVFTTKNTLTIFIFACYIKCYI